MRAENGGFRVKLNEERSYYLCTTLKTARYFTRRERVASLRVGSIKLLAARFGASGISKSRNQQAGKSPRATISDPEAASSRCPELHNSDVCLVYTSILTRMTLDYVESRLTPRETAPKRSNYNSDKAMLATRESHRNRSLGPRGTGTHLSGLDTNFLPVRAFYCSRWPFNIFHRPSRWPR